VDVSPVKKPIEQDVLERLLVAKDLLGRIRFLPTSKPDRATLARQILTSHDSAEIAIAAIARYVDKLPESNEAYLMTYIAKIKSSHPGVDVPGRAFFSDLNRVRVSIKHAGLFPDPAQWHKVAEKTYDYVSILCEKYLGIRFEDLDEIMLIRSEEVRSRLAEAREFFERGEHKLTLEALAYALEALFRDNSALRNLTVGFPRAEDAIKLSAFGVHANDFIALQEFLPRLNAVSSASNRVLWEQEKYGHPANWNSRTAEFCLRTFLQIVLRIQDADSIPGAIDFHRVYEHKVTALIDGVEIRRPPDSPPNVLVVGDEVVCRVLNKGDSIRGIISRFKTPESIIGKMFGPLRIYYFLSLKEKGVYGSIDATKVDVKCVPREEAWIKGLFGDLPELEFVSDDAQDSKQ
jgi:hypothetical protein